MRVLGIDTATSATAAAILDGAADVRERRDDPPPGAHPGHATRLLAMVDELLAEAAIELDAVARIAVGAGPGTFTGLRVGMATARGLAQSLGCELVTVSSLRALAHGARSSGVGAAPLLAAIDARRGEVFAAAYAAGGEELAPPRPIAPGEIGAVLIEAGLTSGGVLGIGDGAVRYRAELEAAGAEVPPAESRLHLLLASAVCELGVRAEPVSYGEALPDYLRRPDAELALEAARGAA
ncbi:MAG TPA: tRNA (adenosine(37)-N6)-threonylcarbamoyltransferase complex dimerization subunit type 1 TsaB [Solirubrobacteraceae bacterium]|nr:tRNA (adenosine(37)-N6)-threonylcarbamoyltransferase complex dimerization subunit type 1 TsaB [Solirubrobacteraceae bacterium]